MKGGLEGCKHYTCYVCRYGLIFLIREKISGSELSPRHHPGWDGMGARYFCDCGFPGQSMHNVF